MSVAEDWDSFRSWYPRREAWAAAEKAFLKLQKAGKLPAMVILKVAIKCQQLPGGCLERVLSSDGRDPRPYPASWLNGQRWHDEYQPRMRNTASQAMGLPEGERRDPGPIDQEAKEKALSWHQEWEAEREAARAEFLKSAKAKK
jgi:hypothetical protein